MRPPSEECPPGEVCECCRLPPGIAMSHSEIAAALGVTRQAVEYIERRALAKLRKNRTLRELWED